MFEAISDSREFDVTACCTDTLMERRLTALRFAQTIREELSME